MAILLFTFILQVQPLPLAPAVEETEYIVRHFTIKDGLPVNSVSQMVQDANGFLWLVTYDGLVRYDGYSFRRYAVGITPGMVTNRISTVLLDSKGNLWITNDNRRLTVKKGTIFKTFTKEEIRGGVLLVFESYAGKIWINTTKGIGFYDEAKGSFRFPNNPLVASKAEAIKKLLNGGLILLNEKGVIHWKAGKGRILLSPEAMPIKMEDVLRIEQFEENSFWIAGNSRAYKIDLKSSEILYTLIPPVENFAIWDINYYKPNKLLIKSNKGFYAYIKDTGKVLKLPQGAGPDPGSVFKGQNGKTFLISNNNVIIDGDFVTKLPDRNFGFLDNEGSLWVGTAGHGLYQIRKSSVQNLNPSDIPGLLNTGSIIQDNRGEIWAASFTSGIYRITSKGVTNWNGQNSPLFSNLCKFIFEDSRGAIYASLWGAGLWKFEGHTWKHIEEFTAALAGYNPTVKAMHRKGDRLFIGSLGPLVVRQNGAFRFFDEKRSKLLSGIQVFKENSRGVLFAGTKSNGLLRIYNHHVMTYSAKSGALSSNSIRDIYLQSHDTLWVATANLGLNRLVLNSQGEVLSTAEVTMEDGLKSNSLHRIINDGMGFFWINSNGGIMRISIKALNRYADGLASKLNVFNFNEKDGMLNREGNGGVQSAGVMTAGEKLWFPNQKGIVIIDPEEFNGTRALAPPKPVIESIQLEDTLFTVSDDSVITLPPGQRNVLINFTAPNFAFPGRVAFRYKMQHVIPDWQQAGLGHRAELTNLPPGKHLFSLSVQRTGGQPRISTLSVIVPAAFYETAWFKLFTGLLFVGFSYSGYRYRVRSLRQREQVLQKRVKDQTAALQEAAEQKSRFFTGITHELKTPLSLVVSPLNDLIENSGKLSAKDTRNRLAFMQRNSERLKHLVNQILDVTRLNVDAVALKLEPVDLMKFTRHILGQFQSELDQNDIKLEYAVGEIDQLIYVDREAWERILINLMSNAMKFSPKGDRIKVSMNDAGNDVTFSIKDEGQGISPEHQKHVFEYLYQIEGDKAPQGTGIGLFLVKGLVEEMGGTITLKSEQGKGAEFIIRLRKGYEHFDAAHSVVHETAEVEELNNEITPVIEPEPETDAEHGEQIMVIEDNYDFRSYLQTILQKHYRVLTATDGDDALHVLKKKQPDLIISDIMMPGMDGMEFVKSLREGQKFRHMPVIFLSAKNREVDIEKGLSTGADLFLTKPVQSKMLLAQIAAVLRRERILKEDDHPEADEKEPVFVTKVREIVYRQLAKSSLNVGHIADTLFISRAKLYMEWNKVSEFTINNYIKKQRMNEAMHLLKEQGFNVQETARAVGYSNAGYFSTSFKKEFGISPSEVTKD